MSDLGNKEVMAKNLNYYVEKSGRTQKELAEVVGVAQSTFNEWCKGKKYPRIDKIEMLANYFGILKSDLIEDKSKNKPTNNGELSEGQKKLYDFVMSVPDDKVDRVLQVMKLIVEGD
jgi:repressor LexA